MYIFTIARERFIIEQNNVLKNIGYKHEKLTNIENFRTDDLSKFWNVIRKNALYNDIIPIKAKAALEHIDDIVLKNSEVLSIWNQNLRSLFTGVPYMSR